MFNRNKCGCMRNCGCRENTCCKPECVTEAPINNCVQRDICHEVKQE